MAVTSGKRVFGSSQVLHQRSGRLLGYLISHEESTTQQVTFYDNTANTGAVLHRVHIAPERSPVYVRFSGAGEAVPFSTGLTVDPGNCDVLVWASG